MLAVRRRGDEVMTGHFPVASWRCYLQAPGGETVAFSLSSKPEQTLNACDTPPPDLSTTRFLLCPGANKHPCVLRGAGPEVAASALGSLQEDRPWQAAGSLVYLCLGACWFSVGRGPLCQERFPTMSLRPRGRPGVPRPARQVHTPLRPRAPPRSQSLTRVPARICPPELTPSCWEAQLPSLLPPPRISACLPVSLPPCVERFLGQSGARGSQPRGLRRASQAKAGQLRDLP